MRFFILSVVLLSASTARASEPLSPPEDMANPRTGEEGTWIPRWVERLHLETNLRLDACKTELTLANQEAAQFRTQIVDLRGAVADLKGGLEHSQEQNIALERTHSRDDARLERRTRALWTVGGIALALFVTTVAVPIVMR